MSIEKAFNAIRTWATGLALVAASAMPLSASAGLIQMSSGVGSFSNVSFLAGPVGTLTTPGFTTAFTNADFAAARSGAETSNVVTPHPAWKPVLNTDLSARWISTETTSSATGRSALFAVPFFIPGPLVSAAIEFNYMVDNGLGSVINGSTINQGLFINGTALSGTTTTAQQVSVSNFQSDQQIIRTDIVSLLQTGINWLYINASNAGGPSGLIFSTEIEFVEATQNPGIPVPSVIALLAIGALAFRARVSPRA
ncbi:MAG: hypothetical protein KDH88_12760 [Chromatiales bacterium]|nr:hypothetical protein [Chromatiales bacterium]